MTCINGICRLPCAARINCGDSGATECADGFCHFESELDFECQRGDDCGDDGLCIDGLCL
jgi:hypothetical protein